MIAVLTGGSALAVPWLVSRAAAVVYAWYPGAEGGHAVADVLFGDVNPAGRLPITIYRSAADLPPFADYAMRGRTYRYFDGEPLYGFGYGLSYTTFRYTQIGAVAGAYAAAAVEVENAGSRPGDEVVQVYVIPRGAPAYAPRRWLAGFQRVSLKPGERRIVKIPFGPNTLTYVDEAGARRPLDGQVDIAVGGRQPDRSGHYAERHPGRHDHARARSQEVGDGRPAWARRSASRIVVSSLSRSSGLRSGGGRPSSSTLCGSRSCAEMTTTGMLAMSGDFRCRARSSKPSR